MSTPTSLITSTVSGSGSTESTAVLATTTSSLGAEESFGHLAAGGVARGKEQYLRLAVHFGPLSLRSTTKLTEGPIASNRGDRVRRKVI